MINPAFIPCECMRPQRLESKVRQADPSLFGQHSPVELLNTIENGPARDAVKALLQLGCTLDGRAAYYSGDIGRNGTEAFEKCCGFYTACARRVVLKGVSFDEAERQLRKENSAKLRGAMTPIG